MNNKKYSLIIVAMVIILLGGFYYFKTHNKTTNNGWQTYSHTADLTNDANFKFSFQYPTGYTIKTVTQPNGSFGGWITNSANPAEIFQLVVSGMPKGEVNLNDSSKKIFTTNSGLTGKENIPNPLWEHGFIDFNIGQKDANSDEILLEFNVSSPSDIPMLDSIAKTLVITK